MFDTSESILSCYYFINQVFGLTVSSPADAFKFKYPSSAIYSPDYWVWFNDQIWNNNIQIQVPHGIPGSLHNGDTVGMAVFPNGELHVYLNGKDIATTFNNLPVNSFLYGFVGINTGGLYYSGTMKLGNFYINL